MLFELFMTKSEIILVVSNHNLNVEAYSIYKGQPVTTCSEIGSASEQLLRLNSKGRKIRYNKKQTKSSKRGRLANQQAVQMLGDKISASSDAANFVSNFQSRAARASNFENFISMSSHYGTNRGVMHPSFDFQKHGSISEKSFSKIHKKSEDGRSLYNHPLITSNNQTAGRDTSAEEIKTGKYRSGHSPLLTKRKHSQKNGNSTSRSKFKHSKNKSKLISLNSNLRQSS